MQPAPSYQARSKVAVLPPLAQTWAMPAVASTFVAPSDGAIGVGSPGAGQSVPSMVTVRWVET